MPCEECKLIHAENERLKQANEQWHQRMSFVKIDTDVLTAQLAAVTQDKDEWLELHQHLEDVVEQTKQQLAAMTARVKELDALKAKQEAP